MGPEIGQTQILNLEKNDQTEKVSWWKNQFEISKFPQIEVFEL